MIKHESGYEECRPSPHYEGWLPRANIIRGHSSVFDESTYVALPEFNITLNDRREQLRDSAIQTANQLGAGAQQGLIATELLSPEVVAALPDDIEPQHAKGLIKALGAACQTIGESQAIHRGFYALTPKLSRAVMRQLCFKPSQLPLFLKDCGEQNWPGCDNTYLDYAAQSPDLTTMQRLLTHAGRVTHNPQEAQKNRVAPRDAIDALAFRHAALQEKLVDPVYYSHQVYEATPRLTSPQECYGMLRHMLAGFWGASGNDHMFLYANDYSRPNSVAGAKGDFSVCRPGNYLYNSLQIVEQQVRKAVEAGDDWIADMPVELVLEYAIANFFQGMQLDAARLWQREGSTQTSFAGRSISGYIGIQEVGFPLRPIDRVIPQRRLRKDGTESRLYGRQDYLNELVDIAAKLDDITTISGRDARLHQPLVDYLADCAQIMHPPSAQHIRTVSKMVRTDNIKPLTIAYTLYDRQLS